MNNALEYFVCDELDIYGYMVNCGKVIPCKVIPLAYSNESRRRRPCYVKLKNLC
uniref:Uncharacterized protein n=1 Tax=Triticum urartu TaxID=4572 RepID=A0A8R7PQ91_TRIUA